MKKRFVLDEPVDVPKNITTVNMPEGNLVIAVENPNWLVTDREETETLYHLKEGARLKDAMITPQSTASLLSKIEEFQFYEGATVPNPTYTPLQLYMTEGCNLRCRHCYRDSGKKLEDELTTEELKRLIDGFSEQGPSIVILSGGEVLTRKDFFEIAHYIKNRDHEIKMVTNGLLIRSEETAREIADIADFIQISLDGATAEVNDYYRGDGTFDRIIQAINQFEHIDKKINIGMVVSEYNHQDIIDNLGHFLKNSIRKKEIKVKIGGLMERGRGSSCGDTTSDDYVDKVLESIDPESNKFFRPPNTKAYDCNYARAITIGSRGQAYYCPVAAPSLDSSMNIRTHSIPKIFRAFKEENKSASVEHMEPCNSCDLEYICAGGCRLRNKEERDNTLKPGCTPEYKNMIYRELVKLRTG